MGASIVPNFEGLDKRSAQTLAEQANVHIAFKGMGIVRAQSSSPGTAFDPQSTIALECATPSYE